MAIGYNNIGRIYHLQGNYPRALEFFQKSLKISIQNEDKSGIAYSYLELGKFALTQKQAGKAKKYFEQALALRQQTGQKSLSAEAYVSLGIAWYTQKGYKQAHKHLEKGVAMALKTGNPIITRNGAEYLSKVYEATGKPQRALDNYRLFKQMADSLLNARNIRQLTQLEDKQREDSLRLTQAKKDALHNADIKQRQLTQQTTYLGLGLSLVLLLVLLFFYRSKQRSNRQLNEAYQDVSRFNQELQTAHREIKVINESLAQKNNEIVASLTYAQRIQQAILPLDEKMNQRLPKHFTLFRPRDIVSGDFYWCDETDNKVFVVAADCTGHGVPGAFMTMLGAQALTNIIVQNKIHQPDRILQELDGVLRQTLKSENTLVRDGMDMVLVVIDEQKKELQYVGAKNPLVLVQNGEIQEMKGSVYSINAPRNEDNAAAFVTHTVDISSPTMLYLYSDGYQDQFGGKKGRKFMKKRLRELLLKVADKPMEEQKQLLETTLDAWMNTENANGTERYEQVDDILVMGVQL